jgi:hypothetical protein
MNIFTNSFRLRLLSDLNFQNPLVPPSKGQETFNPQNASNIQERVENLHRIDENERESQSEQIYKDIFYEVRFAAAAKPILMLKTIEIANQTLLDIKKIKSTKSDRNKERYNKIEESLLSRVKDLNMVLTSAGIEIKKNSDSDELYLSVKESDLCYNFINNLLNDKENLKDHQKDILGSLIGKLVNELRRETNAINATFLTNLYSYAQKHNITVQYN